ncbi:hypothetical protein C1H46_013845 [Malus baccata]|uniref:Uncharacterized protein n=1 Tax=Malus baccata TaxID=106549 RepID=A0A540MP78_MALBA|nr:hypothetical protein C1H46_013845 [Malus baccata]
MISSVISEQYCSVVIVCCSAPHPHSVIETSRCPSLPTLSLSPPRPPPAVPSVTSSSHLTIYPLQTTIDLIPRYTHFGFSFLF